MIRKRISRSGRKRIYRYLRAIGYTRQDLADHLGISTVTLSKYANGKGPPEEFDLFVTKLADYLQVERYSLKQFVEPIIPKCKVCGVQCKDCTKEIEECA